MHADEAPHLQSQISQRVELYEYSITHLRGLSLLYAITSVSRKKSIRVESRASSQKSFRKEWRQVLACDLLNDGFYHVARSLRDPTGLLDLLLDKVRFSFRADTLTSGP